MNFEAIVVVFVRFVLFGAKIMEIHFLFFFYVVS